MGVLTVTPRNVRPLDGAVFGPRMKANAAITNVAGKALSVNSSAKIVETDADAVATSQVYGIGVGVGAAGALDAAANDVLDIVIAGPVDFGADIFTPGALVYNSPTAGGLDHTAPSTGDYPCVVGLALTARILLVRPQAQLPVVV
jgi:hypothetical protein